MVGRLVPTSSTIKIPAYPSMNLSTSWKAKTGLTTTVQVRAKKLTRQVKQRAIHIIQVRTLSLKCAYSRVHISSDEVFSKILEKPHIVQK